MKVSITRKCDRSGRTEELQIDSSEIEQYEQQQQRREETLKTIEEFLAAISSEDMPDLIAVYRGKSYSFINVSERFCDKPVLRLLGQLFHASNPKTRTRKTKTKSKKSKTSEESSKKSNAKAVKETADTSAPPK